MKKIVTVITILNLIYQFNVSAQQIVPNADFKKKETTSVLFDDCKNNICKIKNEIDLLISKSTLSNEDSVLLKKKERQKRKAERKLARLNDSDSFVTFFGGASLNSTKEADNIGGTSRISAQLNIAHRMYLNIGYNLKGVQPVAVSKDSLNLISLMFPEVGNSGYLATLNYDFLDKMDARKKHHQLGIYLDFAFKQSSILIPTMDSIINEESSENISFSSLNYNAGIRYKWTFIPSVDLTKQINFTALAYLNYFNIPDEDANSFQKVFQDNFEKRSSISGCGMKLILQYQGLALFGDFRHNFDTQNLKDDNAFKGFVFNVGTMITTDLFHF